MAFLIHFAPYLTSDLEAMPYAALRSSRDGQTCLDDPVAVCMTQVRRGHEVVVAGVAI